MDDFVLYLLGALAIQSARFHRAGDSCPQCGKPLVKDMTLEIETPPRLAVCLVEDCNYAYGFMWHMRQFMDTYNQDSGKPPIPLIPSHIAARIERAGGVVLSLTGALLIAGDYLRKGDFTRAMRDVDILKEIDDATQSAEQFLEEDAE